MLYRFAAASLVASAIIAAGALGSLLTRFPREGAWILTTVWCFVPVAWGLWSMCAPAGWVPSRFPLWGAILGLVAGIVAGPLLDLPARIGFPGGARWLLLVVAPPLYYLLWGLVGSVYRALHVSDGGAGRSPEGT